MRANRVSLLSGLALATSSITCGAWGQTAGPTTQIGEVVVTAEKRTERLQEVPAAVSVVTNSTIQALDAHSFSDIVNFVPGLTLETDGRSNTLIIRGINAGTVSTPLVGIVVDGVPYGSSSAEAFGGTTAPNLNLSDMERVEVLKGPQGTLYGASAMGGLISYVSKTAVPTKLEGNLDVEGYGTAHGDGSILADGSVAMPLVADKVGLRVSGFYDDLGGYLNNAQTHQSDVNSSVVDGGRGALDIRLSDTLKVDLSAFFQQNDLRSADSVAYNLATHQPLVGSYDVGHALLEPFTQEFQQYAARVTDDLGWGSLTSITGWSRIQTSEREDQTDGAFGQIFNAYFGAATAYVQNDVATDKVTEEVRLTSPTSQGVRWLAGLFYDHEQSGVDQTIWGAGPQGHGPIASLDPAIYILVPSTYQEYAGFGNLTVPVGGRIEVTGGLRVSHNDQTFFQHNGGPLAALFGLSAGGGGDSSDTRVDYLGDIKYQIDAHAMAYFRVATGYRAGGPNTAFPGVPPTFGPDSLISYEVGSKSSFYGGRVAIDASAFYIDWSRIQLTAATPGGEGYFTNGGKARSQGLEASLILTPIAGLSITSNISYVDAELLQDVPQLSAVKGERLPNSPRFSGSVIAEYRWRLWDGFDAIVGGNYRHVGSRTTSFAASINPPEYLLDAYSQVDLNVGIENTRYRVTAFVRNLTDARGFLSDNYYNNAANLTLIRPRQVGVRLSLKF
ncbi:MAG: TonB-dependent receptor [Caulobacteraceae bacterium]